MYNTHRGYDTVLGKKKNSCVLLLPLNCPGISVVNDIISSVYEFTQAYDHLIASHTLFNLIIINTDVSRIFCDSKICGLENRHRSLSNF